MITVVIADSHRLVREGLRRVLEEQKDFRVVADAATGKELVEKARAMSPDVVLLGVALPSLDGLEATGVLLRQHGTRVRVLILTMYADEHYAARLLRAGAAGYVFKDSAPSELAEAIRAVHRGETYVCAPVRDALALRFVKGPDREPLDRLSDREFQVLLRLAAGATNREIARELSISVKTVDAHRAHVMTKLSLRNNADLTRLAMEHGIAGLFLAKAPSRLAATEFHHGAKGLKPAPWADAGHSPFEKTPGPG
jgi:DNA-binding NarL/FixJ family response regulator